MTENKRFHYYFVELCLPLIKEGKSKCEVYNELCKKLEYDLIDSNTITEWFACVENVDFDLENKVKGGF